METSYPDWRSLPAEILSKIFYSAGMHGHLPDRNNAKCVSSQAALVCKAWRSPAQLFLYSHVYINSILQLRKFHDAIRCSTYIGTMVKVLKLHLYSTSGSYKTELLDIVTNLLSNYLPNLVSIYQANHHSYIPTLNALLNFKLKYLRSIQAPSYQTKSDELVHYVSCALLMMDRLQEVYITDDFSNPWHESTSELALVKFQELYDKLGQFYNLKKIKIRRQTSDGVQVLEHIAEACRSLRDINFILSSMNNQYDAVEPKDSIGFDTMSHYAPRSNIKTLTGYFSTSVLENSKILFYITKKFPNVEEIYLDTNEYTLQATPYVILELLNYLVKIKSVSVTNLTTNQGDIYQIIGNFWNTTSKPGMQNVKFSYHYRSIIEGKSPFAISKSPAKGTKISLDFSLQLLNRQPHLDFIKKNGKFIGDLTFKFGECNLFHCNTSDNFLFHIFTHCPNLRNLYIKYFALQECTHSTFDRTKKYSVDKLTLKDCATNPYALEQLLTVLSEVKQLHLIDNECFNDDEEDYISIINIPQTRVNFIKFGRTSEEYPTYLKLFVIVDQTYYYYQSDTKTNSIASSRPRTTTAKQIDEKLYDAVDGEEFQKTEIRCDKTLSPHWKSLPLEILTEIFRFAATEEGQEDSSNFALVCKKWRNPAQSVLYSYVTIYSISQLKKFRDIIQYNTYFGTKVKALNLKIDDEADKTALLAIVTTLLYNCLPNLISLYQDRYHSYVPTIIALLDSKLKYLKSIQTPTYKTNGDELVHYISCAILMRDRLQEVYISNNFSNFRYTDVNELTITKFQHLYDNLSQFDNLTKICITRKTDDGIQVLEHIVETCRSLRNIDLTLSSLNYTYDGNIVLTLSSLNYTHNENFDLTLPFMNDKYDDIQLKNDFNSDTISHYIPRYNIKTISGQLYMSTLENCKVLLYIMEKFPNLEELYLGTKRKSSQVTPYVILQLLNYLEKIKKLSVFNLTMGQGHIYNIIGDFWNTTSKPGVENVKFCYFKLCNDDVKSSFAINKDPIKGTQITFNNFFLVSDHEQYEDFIEKNGKFIGDLTYKHDCPSGDSYDNFLIGIFMHCPNLRTLYIKDFKLQECVHSRFDETIKRTLDKLTLEYCYVEPGTLEQLSKILIVVKQLHLIGALDYTGEDGIFTNNMPQTKIQRIILGLSCDEYPTYVKLFVVANQKYYYYQSGIETDTIASSEPKLVVKQIDEKAFNEIDEDYYKFHICCKSKPEIIFE